MNAALTAVVLLRVIEHEAPPTAYEWLRPFVRAERFDTASFFNTYAASARRFAVARGEFRPEHATALREIGCAYPEAWSLPDVVRAYLLTESCARLESIEHDSLVCEVFRKGDNAERIALLRALPLLPSPARFTETAIEACRSHVQDVFEAIACDNTYPAEHFADLNFQQLVMKALFTGAPLSRVHGLRSRITDELRRMAADFAAERTAAGRPVPRDVSLIVD